MKRGSPVSLSLLQVDCEDYKAVITKFGIRLDGYLEEFMRRLWDDSKAQFHSHLSNLCTRLDYNGYHTSRWASERW